MANTNANATAQVEQRLTELKKSYEAHKQGHVLKFVSSLNLEQKQSLLHDLENIDLDQVERMFAAVKQQEKEKKAEEVTPFKRVTDATSASESDRKQWYERGLLAIANNEVGLLLLGGGQGTRLGFDKPKGMYDILLPSHKTLFQIQGERLKRLKVIAAQLAKKDVSQVSLPWYVMTSEHTRHETFKFFEEHKFFGLPKDDIFFFEQGTLPCLTPDGKIIMQSTYQVATAPNGNGGVYEALGKHGVLADMEKRNVKYVHTYCVDNALVKVADPSFIGFCVSKGADCANKVVRKEIPNEPVGVMCERNGVVGVIEYSEIAKELTELRDATTGQLVYNAANIANHYFSTEFLNAMAKAHLPFHIAEKKIPFVNDEGKTVSPDKPNGIKLEMFVFDVFPFSKNIVAYLVSRDTDFAAVKNAPGKGSKDSRDTARKAISDYHIKLATAAGATFLKPDDEDAVFEISPLVSYDGEGLKELVNGKTFKAPFELKEQN